MPRRAQSQLLAPPSAPNQIVVDATNVLTQSVAMPSGLPQSLLTSAQGIAIVPNNVRGAFIVGIQRGRGVLLVRGPDGAWQAPRMIEITGGSLGYQVGVQSTDLILVFRTPQSVANVMRGKLKVGVDASAAAGPVGRQASAATDASLQAEIYSYSRARGAFLGASIDGSSISLDSASDASYYQPPGTVPASAVQLVQQVTALSSNLPQTVSPPTLTTAASPVVVPQPSNEFEVIRQRLDASSRQVAAIVDDQWKQYLALPAGLYTPNQMPSFADVQETTKRYEAVAQQPQYAELTRQPAFQATLQGLRRLGELQRGGQRKVSFHDGSRGN